MTYLSLRSCYKARLRRTIVDVARTCQNANVGRLKQKYSINYKICVFI